MTCQKRKDDMFSHDKAHTLQTPAPTRQSQPRRHPWALLTLACLGLLAVDACDKRRTQVMLGISTDMDAPAPMDEVHLQIFDLDHPEQLPFTDLFWPISGTTSQQFQIPGSFGIFSPNGTQARIRIDLTASGAGAILLHRTSTMRLIEEQTLFMRMALVGACMKATDCPANQTCVEGNCRIAEVDPRTFPRYQPAMEETIACDSGTAFMNTSTKELMKQSGPGCAPNQFFLEGTCYTPITGKKRIGETCSPTDACEPGSVCFNSFCVGSGSLRVSLTWAAMSDFDLHVATPAGDEISYLNPMSSGGVLDVDQCADACVGTTHVENIVFSSAPPAGVYRVWVENFDGVAAAPFSIEVAGSATSTFAGSLPATVDAKSTEFTFTVAAP